MPHAANRRDPRRSAEICAARRVPYAVRRASVLRTIHSIVNHTCAPCGLHQSSRSRHCRERSSRPRYVRPGGFDSRRAEKSLRSSLAGPARRRDGPVHDRAGLLRGGVRHRRLRRARRDRFGRGHARVRDRRVARPRAERVARPRPRRDHELRLRLAAGPPAGQPRAGRHAQGRGRIRPRHRAGAARYGRPARPRAAARLRRVR